MPTIRYNFSAENVPGLCEKLVENSPDFVSLIISVAAAITNDGWKKTANAMKQNHTLENIRIYFGRETFGVSAAMYLSGALRVHPSLKEIALFYAKFNESFTPIALALQENPKLSHLGLHYCVLSPDQMESVGFLLRENALEAPAIFTDGGHLNFPGLSRNQSLKDLSIYHVQREEGNSTVVDSSPLLVGITHMLERNQNLEKLNLHLQQGDVNAYTLSSLANAAKGHKSLRDFCLFISDSTARQYGGQAVGDFVATAKSLEKVELSGCRVGGDSELLEQLCRGVQSETCVLKVLSLSENSIDDTGAIMLSNALCRTKTVESVCLCHNRIRNNGASRLALAMNENSNLVDLNLCGNSIGPQGAVAIAGALGRNCSLRNLNLNLNPIHGTGVCAIVNALTTNTNLQELGLSCLIGHQGLSGLTQDLPFLSLKTLRVGFNPCFIISSEHATRFLKAVEQNVLLQDMNIDDIKNHTHLLDILPQVERLLKLNKAGRRALSSRNVPRSLWPLILSKSSTDADTIYYFLQQNPTLFMKQQRQQALGKRKRDESS